ncbi:hypothetical protein H2201_003030 [Coniosporium apollinis]|uniref:Inhibitor I9 domain-containing protein n=1 Tax=Coniosporium apollinis TaxID=61459 RepID=A0ABQ9NYW3_9PEZI|nr:hypothetical protein H2201_003030 [Coniosporium apollinis]
MPNKVINVSVKDGGDAGELEKLKKQIQDQGGKITHEFKLIKGFTAEVPDDAISTLQDNQHLNVEPDQEVRTQ